MRIGIIGAGNVGGTLGRRWAALGHDVTFGVRGAPDAELRAIVDGARGRARAAPVADAVRDAEVVVLATPWAAVPDALASAGPLDGKVLFDCTNPLKPGFTLDVGPGGESGAERVAALAKGARVVKVFNTTGFNNMADPSYGGEPTLMLYAGDDADAKAVAKRLATELGFEAVDAGPLARARLLEAFALVWITLAFGGLGREIAFRLVRR
jgi:8-hydroxy-5-deazaflavin:NADPH oxidoreductase